MYAGKILTRRERHRKSKRSFFALNLLSFYMEVNYILMEFKA